MSDTPYIKFFPSDFLGGVGGLSPTERGVYITILCLIWDGDGPVDLNDDRLARRCGMPKAPFKKALQALIDEGKLTRTDEGLTNKKAEKVLSDRQYRIENAKAAASAKWSKEHEKTQQNQGKKSAGALRQDMHRECVADAKPEARSQSTAAQYSAREVSGPDPTHRERLLKAAGADPGSGTIGPNGTVLGTVAHMEHAKRWSELGLSIETQCAVIAETVRRKQDADPFFAPKSFAYFDGAMEDAARAGRVPGRGRRSAEDANTAFLRKVAGQN